MSKIYLCGECYLLGFCRRLTATIVAENELTSTFIADVRATMRALDISRHQWVEYLLAAYRDYPGCIIDKAGNEIELDTRVLELASIRDWFRYLCRPIPDGVTPRLRKEAKQRFIVTATILRAVHPVTAILWGKGVANDVAPSLKAFPTRTQDACPYLPFVIGSWGVKCDHRPIFE